MVAVAENKKLDYIDSLRGYALLAVVLRHAMLTDKDILGSTFLNLGAKGVQLFYIVSAFTLMLSYTNRKNEKKALLSFFLRRFFRIAPMFYLAISYYYITANNQVINSVNTIYNLIAHFLFCHGFSPYWENTLVPGGWSVAVEVMFYCFCPWLFQKVHNISSAMWFFISSLLASQLLIFYFEAYPMIEDEMLWSEFLYIYFPTQLPVFLLGFVVFFMVRNDNMKVVFYGVSCLISLCVFSYLFQVIFQISLNTFNNLCVSVCFSLLVVFLSKKQSFIIVNPLITFFGKISYSMYLVHFAVIEFIVENGWSNLLENGTLNYVLRLVFILILSVSISYFFYRFVEIPFQKKGKVAIDYFSK